MAPPHTIWFFYGFIDSAISYRRKAVANSSYLLATAEVMFHLSDMDHIKSIDIRSVDENLICGGLPPPPNVSVSAPQTICGLQKAFPYGLRGTDMISLFSNEANGIPDRCASSAADGSE